MTLHLQGLTKRFAEKVAVDQLELVVPEGAMFGFLGSNGAGKTTTIRMVLGLMRPDEGTMTWKQESLSQATRERIGYLAEERGLYPKMKVLDQLVYFGRLRGLSAVEAYKQAEGWLERLGIQDYRLNRADQLSKGNQQKVQFIAAVIHRPELVILDEPFSGLDPVNRQVLQEALLYVHQQGTTIMFSSHQMDMVESLCRDVALIHNSRLVMAGNLRDIKRASGRQVIHLVMDGPYDFLDSFNVLVESQADGVSVRCKDNVDPQDILRAAIQVGKVRCWELGEPSLAELYVERVRGLNA